LIPRFEALSSAEVLAPVMDLLPAETSLVLDVGAGTGRDAAWLAGRGHRVVAVEPVAELRVAGEALHPSGNISWLDDRLPMLAATRARGEKYDLILVVAVWQHLPPEQHPAAVANLAAMLAPGARLIMSLRHGPGAPTRACFPVSPGTILGAAEGAGLTLVANRESESIQQRNRDAGVTWTWLCLDKQAPA
jgi:SAM-dependent methyltransferase